jgi:hypothetical protein
MATPEPGVWVVKLSASIKYFTKNYQVISEDGYN